MGRSVQTIVTSGCLIAFSDPESRKLNACRGLVFDTRQLLTSSCQRKASDCCALLEYFIFSRSRISFRRCRHLSFAPEDCIQPTRPDIPRIRRPRLRHGIRSRQLGELIPRVATAAQPCRPSGRPCDPRPALALRGLQRYGPRPTSRTRSPLSPFALYSRSAPHLIPAPGATRDYSQSRVSCRAQPRPVRPYRIYTGP